MNLRAPLVGNYPVTQSYAHHLERAKANGWCSKPGLGCRTYYYPGIDWGCPEGTPVYAAADGIVMKAKIDQTGYGLCVQLQHAGGFQTLYAHLSKISVQAGKTVETGDLIGFSGNTGNSTGPHLHYELRDPTGVPIDPSQYLQPGMGESEEQPVPIRAGDAVMLLPGWNLRAGPGTQYADLGTSDETIPGKALEMQGEWLKMQMEVWVHREAVQAG